jgi:regulator of protease activity HflC (stomatin/prohibitin superfamily)
LDFTIAANQIANSGANANSYEMRNTLLEVRRKARVRYKHGQTLPATAEKLRADAERKVRHSRTLARNIKNATGVAKAAQADAHHIVAQADRRADRSRLVLFGWGIGINDVDNGVYLPKKFSSKVAGLEDATAHENIHTDEYYLAVEVRLADAGREPERGRQALRGIKGEILKNQFIY